MPLVIPIGSAEIALHFSFVGDPEDMVTTFGVSITSQPTASDLEDLATFFHANFDDILVDEMHLIRARAAVGTSGDPVIVEAVFDLPFSAAGTPLLPNSALLIKKVTGVGGRSNRGRMFLPGYRSESVFSYGVINPTNVPPIQDAADAFLAGIGGVTGPWGVMQLLHTDAAPSTVATDVIALVVDSRIASQRRRLRP